MFLLVGFHRCCIGALYGFALSETISRCSCFFRLSSMSRRTQEEMVPNRALEIFQTHGRQDDVLPLILAENSRDELLRLNQSLDWHSPVLDMISMML